jgi:hypothetical protein
MAEQEDSGRPVVGLRIELERGARTLRGTVEQANNDLLLVRWDSGGISTLRRDRGLPRVVGHYGHYGVSALDVAAD